MKRWGSFILLIFLIIPQTNAQDEKLENIGQLNSRPRSKAYYKRYFKRQLAAYTLAIIEDYTVDESYYQKADANFNLNNDSAAIADCTAGIKQNPNSTKCYLLRGNIYYHIEDYQAAYTDFLAHTNIHEETLHSLNFKAETLIKLKDYDKALLLYNELIRKHPETCRYFVWRALCLIETGRLGEAKLDLKAAYDLGDENYEYYHVLGLYALKTKEPRKSIIAFSHLLLESKHSNFDWDSFWYLSNAYRAIGQLDSALIHINTAISAQEKPEYYIDRANYNAELGDLDKAQEDYSKTIKLDSNLTAAYNNRTFFIWFPRKEYQNAVDDLSKIIEIDPDNAYAYSNRSYAYLGLKDFEHAFIDAFKSVEMENRNPYVYKNLALMYFAIGEKEEATNAAKGALNWGFPVDSDREFQDLLIALDITQ